MSASVNCSGMAFLACSPRSSIWQHFGCFRLRQRQISYWFAGYGPDVPDDLDHRRTEDVGKAGIECGSDHRELCAE